MMEITIKLKVPEDFISLCTIYNIQPEIMIQSFADNVSFPAYYTKANSSNRWATLFFLQFIDMQAQEIESENELEDQYLQCFTDTLTINLEEHDDDGAKAREEGRKVIDKWQKAVIAARSKYILDQL